MTIFRSSFTKNGVTYYAKDYGKKAFPIHVGGRNANKGKASKKNSILTT
ncbi:MAG: hypothetical protein ABFC84_18355 [Veillonellales bacterium]